MQNSSLSDVPFDGSESSNLFSESLDLLVDGELNDQQRRELLLKLESMENGWKHCAMAFLDAALFRDALGQKSKNGIPKGQLWNQVFEVPIPVPASKIPSKIQNQTYKLPLLSKTNLVPVAAGFLLAFFVSGVLLSMILTSSKGPGDRTIISEVAVEQGIQNSPLAQHHLEPFSSMAIQQTNGSHENLQYVTLHSSNPDFQGMVFPCYSSHKIDPEKYLSSTTNIPQHEIQRLCDAGHQVSIQRQNIVVQISDGRHAVIPVDQIQVKYTPHGDYQ